MFPFSDRVQLIILNSSTLNRSSSLSQANSQTMENLQRSSSNLSQSSQTAQDYITSQLSLEADAREALPYQFDTCTYPLGPLRQSVYACLTCAPPPASKHQQFTPAGVCYSCSISCHGEHNLVELFTKRDFVCDCGTTRLENSGTPCSLRHNAETGGKGGVKSQEARKGNRYNQNFEGRFCGCGEEYDPDKEKGTMFQCLGLGTVEDGGCGEDWWHPECLLGLPRVRHDETAKFEAAGGLETVKEEAEDTPPTVNDAAGEEEKDDDPPLPPGFPNEDDFDHVLCYKCVNTFPWIKAYSASPGFLIAVQPRAQTSGESLAETKSSEDTEANGSGAQTNGNHGASALPPPTGQAESTPTQSTDSLPATLKRKAEEDLEESQESKRTKPENPSPPKHIPLPPAPSLEYPTLFLQDDFREHMCRCSACFPALSKHPQLLEEEESYEPPMSESSEGGDSQSIAGRSVNSGSLLERGEAALSSMDRVRAIEGVMAYNHVRDKLKQFLQPFAESGQPVGAEDIKAYFAKLRGDETGEKATASGVEGDSRKEQEGY
jgi:E3 ubiquitin-protein ligase UBR7